MTQFGDLKNAAVAKQLLVPRAITTTTTSTYSDMGNGGGGQFGTTMVLVKGAVSGTSPTLDIKLTECDTTNGTYTDITGATFAQQTTQSTDSDDSVLTSFFVRSKRYVKAVLTTGGTTPSFLVGITLLEQKRTL